MSHNHHHQTFLHDSRSIDGTRGTINGNQCFDVVVWLIRHSLFSIVPSQSQTNCINLGSCSFPMRSISSTGPYTMSAPCSCWKMCGRCDVQLFPRLVDSDSQSLSLPLSANSIADLPGLVPNICPREDHSETLALLAPPVQQLSLLPQGPTWRTHCDQGQQTCFLSLPSGLGAQHSSTRLVEEDTDFLCQRSRRARVSTGYPQREIGPSNIQDRGKQLSNGLDFEQNPNAHDDSRNDPTVLQML